MWCTTSSSARSLGTSPPRPWTIAFGDLSSTSGELTSSPMMSPALPPFLALRFLREMKPRWSQHHPKEPQHEQGRKHLREPLRELNLQSRRYPKSCHRLRPLPLLDLRRSQNHLQWKPHREGARSGSRQQGSSDFNRDDTHELTTDAPLELTKGHAELQSTWRRL